MIRMLSEILKANVDCGCILRKLSRVIEIKSQMILKISVIQEINDETFSLIPISLLIVSTTPTQS